MSDKLKETVANIKKALHQSQGVDTGEQLESTDEDINVEKLKEFVEGFKQKLAASSSPAGPGMNIHWSIFLIAFLILFTFVGLFAYRLVQSLKEKERKREEKKKLKELKKKK